MSYSPVVLEGNELKLRLQAAQAQVKGYVHIDWLRFTVYRRYAPVPSEELLFPKPLQQSLTYKTSDYQRLMCPEDHAEKVHATRMAQLLSEFTESDYMAGAQAYELGLEVVAVLGDEFTIDKEFRKGKDFYKYRFDILRHGKSVGWVGFLASSEGQKGQGLSETLHVNLEGMACTFAQSGWRYEMADLIDKRRALITRVDQALDFFDGIEGGIERFPQEYMNGLFDHCHQRPSSKRDGSWDFDPVKSPNKGRSFYVGSRATGKLTDIYEKGIKEFGFESANPWVRVELRWGNQKRVIPSNILRDSARYFAGASDWHASILREHGLATIGENIPCEARLPVQSIEAEVERNARWFLRTAGASARFALQFLDTKSFNVILDDVSRIPNRLRKFTDSEIGSAYSKVFKRISHVGRVDAAFA